ncbi:MAG: DNA mismatch repair endonuclease MutL [Candidatus Margulisbacteria bacterium]|nr:DNA mismatch repair endonuclease MutL [Candidatus Margulisiibacteriota bacterium]
MGKIKVLDQDTVNKIAAGEVVGRPYSVVKELVENALDAEARSIRVELQNGGKTYIRVIDDGTGMDEADADLAFIRHATSKIDNVEDLPFLTSMGFRGEAIPSIASVSKFTLQTKRAEDKEGTEIIIEGGQRIAKNKLPLADGTFIIVKDLFYNVPARLKYLKADRTEFQHILKFISSLALIYPQISFQLFNEQKKVFGTSGDNRQDEVVSEVFAYDVFKTMKKISYLVNDIKITGYISIPSCTRIDRDKQFVFVNKRVVNSDLVMKALRSATSYIFPPQRYPYCYLHIEVDPSEVDINVHPAKLEVKFAQENAVYRAVFNAIKEVFEKGLTDNSYTSLPLDGQHDDNKIVVSPHTYLKKDMYQKPMTRIDMEKLFGTEQQQNEMQNSDQTYNILKKFIEGDNADDAAPNRDQLEVLQFLKTYLVFWYDEQLYMIDQHIAHERFLYEKLKDKTMKVMSQELLLPETVFLDPMEQSRFEENKLLLHECGFKIEEFGKGTYIIRAVPHFLAHKSLKNILQDILAENNDKDENKRYNLMLMQIACKSAIKAGDYLTPAERVQLIKDWLKTDNNLSCPHGRPIVKTWQKNEIEQWFMRR